MLTDRQQDTYNFIVHYFEEHQRAPLLSEVAHGIGLSSQGSVHNYIQALVNEGLIERAVGRSRGLRLIEQHNESERLSVILPLLGKVAAGRLIEAVPDESEIDLGEMFSGSGRFVLKVNGDSMIDKAIMSGDYVVLQEQRTANHGDIVLALVDFHDATLKTLLINNDGTVTLQPANADYEPVTLPAERVMIQGVVVGQLRTYS
ncbi:MAG: transcriptional repressor LexA [Pseudomonadota bacterium]|nr:transcriptional repressor LexA [Pseudomonadota bacterium]MDO7711632.1 transcriptional repressor LexA [Pseudomonadota bacterium]